MEFLGKAIAWTDPFGWVEFVRYSCISFSRILQIAGHASKQMSSPGTKAEHYGSCIAEDGLLHSYSTNILGFTNILFQSQVKKPACVPSLMSLVACPQSWQDLASTNGFETQRTKNNQFLVMSL